jgi:hypothetical protein
MPRSRGSYTRILFRFILGDWEDQVPRDAMGETIDATRLHQYYFRWRRSFPNNYAREVYHPN